VKKFPERTAAESAASFLIERAVKRGASAADVLYTFNSGHSLSLLDGEPEKISSGFSLGIGLRTLDSAGRQGVAHVNSLDRNLLEEVVEWSFSNCMSSEPDAFVALSDPIPACTEDLALTDEAVLNLSSSDRMAFCREMWETARSADPRVVSVRSASWGDGAGEVLYASSTGAMMWYEGASAGCGVSVILSSGDEMEMGGYGDESRFLASLQPRATALEAVRRTAMVLGGEPLPTGKYDLLLDPESSASFVEVLGELFLASNIHKNKSFLKGKLGERIASPALTLVDDGTLKGGIGAAPFDGEGIPCSRTCLLSGGVVESWLYNLKYARIDGVASTGNAARSVSGTPDVDCSNLFLLPGKWTPQDLLLQVGSGIMVTELLGLHTMNPVSGDFSLGIKGVRIKDGTLSEPVAGMTVAGNLKDVLRSIDLVGNDFKFFGSIGSCSLVIRDVTAAGT
jgi:PmbA protein